MPAVANAKPADVKKFEREIRKKSKKVDFSEFMDDYAERLADLAAKKQKRKEGVVRVSAEAAEPEGGEVIDLLEVLRKSMATTGSGRRAPKKAAAKTKSTRKKRA